ncbi:3-oxoacyl-[acyl-carrier protein] reductase, partial [Formosa agariphila KMM 3901]
VLYFAFKYDKDYTKEKIMTELKSKKAIITGGSRGLGKATAIAFAKEGIDVAITGRNEAQLTATVAELKALGVNATYAAFDVSNYEDVKTGINTLIDTLGGVDILVNNAGIAAFGSLNDMPVDQWTQIIQTNVMGMYYVTKEVLPHLITQNDGEIINVSSTAGLSGNATTSAYSASKFAVIGMSESLMKEVRKNNIRVCTLTPSTIASDMSIDLGIATKDSEDSVLQPEDFAELILAGLKLPKRAMLKSAALWSTNP